VTEVLDCYVGASRLSGAGSSARMVLQTAAGMTPGGLVANPVFFDGALSRPDVAAAGLRTLVEIASSRYFKPIPGGFASLDPVVTAHGERLRCEAFSACNGVYARLDLDGESLGNASLGFGTTNIDINPPLALALAGIQARGSLHLRVGPEAIDVNADGASFTERKVALPERWVRGLAETQSLAAGLELRAILDAAGWRRLFGGLSMSGGSGAGVSLWLVPAAGGLRQTARPSAEAISLAGSARLSAIRRLQHLVTAVRIYGPRVGAETDAAVSGWEFFLPGGRLTLMLSPEPYRGFSGEGAVLRALSQADMDAGITLGALLAWDASIDLQALAREMELPAERVQDGLHVLATAGQVGFDLHEGRYFHRQLPFVAARLEANYPRLVAARALVAAGAVRPHGAHLQVTSDEHVYFVSLEEAPPRCSCPFWAKHRGSRGPCKHVLAAQIHRDGTAPSATD
jgi:hypothetical protein